MNASPRMVTVAGKIAATITAAENCARSGNVEWERRHRYALAHIIANNLPHGGGFDRGVSIDDDSDTRALRFRVEFHPMNSDGYYEPWIAYRVTARAEFDGIAINIRGPDANGARDYVADSMHEALSAMVPA